MFHTVCTLHPNYRQGLESSTVELEGSITRLSANQKPTVAQRRVFNERGWVYSNLI